MRGAVNTEEGKVKKEGKKKNRTLELPKGNLTMEAKKNA